MYTHTGDRAIVSGYSEPMPQKKEGRTGEEEKEGVGGGREALRGEVGSTAGDLLLGKNRSVSNSHLALSLFTLTTFIPKAGFPAVC